MSSGRSEMTREERDFYFDKYYRLYHKNAGHVSDAEKAKSVSNTSQSEYTIVKTKTYR